MKRRVFIQKMGLGGVMLSTGQVPMQRWAEPDITKLVILHTNDVHSRIEPFPMDGSRNEGMGGAARRARLIENIRRTEEQVLLFDAGDIFQGTPYFNFFGGELEFKLMSAMRYDAATIGNHDFDAGIDGLHQQLPHANFPLITANYDFSDTIMDGKTQPYKIFKKGPVKVGVFGVGIELEGLVPATLYGNTQYLDPLEVANRYAKRLKLDEKCDYVICLSHLGLRYRGKKVSDEVLAQNSEHIDLIIGGHTHTFLAEPAIMKNKAGQAVIVNQVGWAGIMLGRLDIFFESNRKGRCISCENILVGS